MIDILGIIFCIGLVVAFFYFGYRHDYRRNPKEFWSSIFGVFINMFSYMNGIPFVSDWVKRWQKKDTKE